MEATQEKNHFDTFGYVIKRELFSREEMASFSSWFDEGFDAKCGPLDRSGKRQMYIPGIGLHDGFCNEYLADPRLLDTLENLMGEGFLMFASDAQRLTDSPWHRDTAENASELKNSDEYLQLKVVMYLDDLSAGPGCLSIMPGSHHKGWRDALQDVLRDHNKQIGADGMTAAGIPPTDIPGAVLTRTRPGDIIFFNQRCFHSSWGGQVGRRYFAFTFYEKPTADWQVEKIIEDCEKEERMYASPRYSKALLETKNPRLRKLIDYFVDRGLCQSA